MLDEKIFYFLNNLSGHSCFFDSLVIFFASYFEYFLVVIFLFLLFYSGYSKRKKYFFLFTVFLSPLLARFGVVSFVRYLFYRPRPFLTLSVNQLISASTSSFPSGHAAFFFAMATAVFLLNKKWGVWFFIAGALISISRVIAGVHYLSDIVAGAVVGVTVAYVVYFLSKKLYLKN